MSTPTPHDALFKATFGQPKHAASMLRSVLPPSLVQRIDWRSLRRVSTSFIAKNLAERRTDLLFEAKLGKHRTLLHLLYEHQSDSHPFMPLRMLEYSVLIWNDWRRRHEKATRLPAIIPVILHHSDTGWRASTRFLDLIDLDDDIKQELAPFLIDFHCVLDDLSHQSEEQLQARALTALAEVVARMFQSLPYGADPLVVLEKLAPLLLRVMSAPNGLSALSEVLRYAMQVSDVEVSALRSLVATHLGKPAEEAIMTTAEKLEQQGFAKGEARGRAALLLKLLRLKYAKHTPLPETVIARVQSATIEELDRWTERVLDASSLSDVLR